MAQGRVQWVKIIKLHLGITMETVDKIKQQISENPIILYMKGSPKLPSCGFSSQVAQVMINCGEQFAFVDILQHPDIRAELPKFANWPTFPQLWVEGELIGGCDIITEMYQKGELQPIIKETADKFRTEEGAE
ncbi:Glutaredoxin [Shewanella japonica]|uniref:Glutaredoxin n=2 Tax=Shewanellaceae TaxID=267890 RepID=A0ABN4YHY3_9GAMM|nr:Glutaredoxin [Shewanella japonica]